jgi:hypothetical protein
MKVMFVCVLLSIALREGLRRGWLSYTDLGLLLDQRLLKLALSHVGIEWLKVRNMFSLFLIFSLFSMYYIFYLKG